MQKEVNMKRKLVLIICVIFFLIVQGCMMILNNTAGNNYNGVLMAFQFLACLIMVNADYKWGIILSYALIGLGMFSIFNVMLRFHNIGALPGLCNMLIYTVTLTLLGYQFKIRDKESVTDFLTGLENRRGLYYYLGKKVEEKDPFYVIYIDLGNFKLINDNYGHTYGDHLLKLITERMNRVIEDRGLLSRIGGDEFVFVLDGKYDAGMASQKILDAISEKISSAIDGVKVDNYLNGYIGIASFPKDATDVETLIKYADIAMYQATKEKSNSICFFDKEMEKRLEQEIEMDKLIKEGLMHDYFYLVYQPQYSLTDKKLRGFETLLRMRTPEGREISPGSFIPVAEKGDRILQIDDYVLRRAMTEFKALATGESNLTISVNVSAKNIGSDGFAQKVQSMMEEIGFPADHLEIEITEYCFVNSMEYAIDNIKKLREIGTQIALDDFGTGYTSLSYLAKMPINLLKVDKSLIDDVVENDKSRRFVNAVIAMGHMMGCEVISEGVEDEEQIDALKEQKCDFIQGFVWGRPMVYEEACKLVP